MPLFSRKKSHELLAQAPSYQILFSFKQDSSKQVCKALRKDKETGLEQEALLKIFLDKNQESSCRKEFESLSRVLSPYCVRPLGFESFAGKKALVLEYIKGASLFDLSDHFSLSDREIQYILSSIYKGLQDLSRHGLCHGDLSLNNVLIDEKAHIKLIDFGKANYQNELQGTPPFAAPEIFQGAGANFLSDLYSLGIIEAALKNSYPLSSLKNMKREDFQSQSPLLSLDPAARRFPYEAEFSLRARELKILRFKIKDIVSLMELRRCRTVKLQSSAPSFFSLSAAKSFFRRALNFFDIKNLKSPIAVKNFLLGLVLFFAGAAPVQSQGNPQGFLKIYTNKWFKIRLGGFESYTPLVIPLNSGWRAIHWESARASGKMKIFIAKGAPLFLKDEDFLKAEKSALKKASP